MHNVDQFLAHYGYFAVFGLLMLGIVGPLIPDETILVFAGIAIHRGQLQPLPTVSAAIAGSLCGITLSYLLGRSGVVYAVKHMPILQRYVGRHLPDAREWFARYGKWTLFFGYFIAGVRHFTALAAGTSGLAPATFALYAYPGGCVWAVCFITIGFYLGEEWQHIAKRFDTAAMVLAVLIALVSIVWWGVSRIKHKNK
jgi:membrane protein DedA with SNARE-associated domain